MSKLINYFKETKSELKHVNWPNRKEIIRFTVLVIAVSIVVSLFLGLFDFIFTTLLDRFII